MYPQLKDFLKLEIEGNLVNLKEDIRENPASSILLKAGRLNAPPLRLGTRQDVPCAIPVKNGIESPSQCHKTRKRGERKKYNSLFVIIYVDGSKEYTKNLPK